MEGSEIRVADGAAVMASEVMRGWPYRLGRYCLTEDGHILESFFDWPRREEPRRLEDSVRHPGCLDVVWDEFFEGDENGERFQVFECHVSRLIAYASTKEELEEYMKKEVERREGK